MKYTHPRYVALWLAVLGACIAVPGSHGMAMLWAQPTDTVDDDGDDDDTAEDVPDADEAPVEEAADEAPEASSDADAGETAADETAEATDDGAADAGADGSADAAATGDGADAGDDDGDTADVAAAGSGSDGGDDADDGNDGATADAAAAGSGGDDDADDGDDGATAGSATAAAGDDGNDDDGDDKAGADTAAAAGSATAAAGGDDDDESDDNNRSDPAADAVASTDANDDDSDDKAAVAPGGGGSGGKDDDGDDGDGDDGAGDDAPQYVATEAAAEREQSDRRDRIDADDEGFRYRRGEIVALDIGDKDLVRLKSAGFTVVARERVPALGSTATLLKTPARNSDENSLLALDELLPDASFGFNHLYDRASVRTRGKAPPVRPGKQACGCRIGVIDTGVAAKLPGLQHARILQASFNGGTPGPALHGTVISSLIAGTRPRAGVPTEIIVGDVFSGPRQTAGSAFAVIKALDWIAARGVAVINVSLAGANNQALADAIARLSARGHVIVAAAGNDGPAAPPAFPAAYAHVVAVTAVDSADQVYRYAGRGKHVHFSARGVDVIGLDANGKLQSVTGTSFAAPAVAIRLAQAIKVPDARAATSALAALEKGARDLGAPGRDPVFGAGLVEE